MSEYGIDELTKSEGIYYQVYDDATGKVVSSYDQVKGYPTIGIGHLIKDSEREEYSRYLGGREKMTLDQVKALLRGEIHKYEDPIKKRLQKPVTQEMFDALVSLGYNIGTNGRALKNAIAAINDENYQAAADFIRSGPVHSKGRRLLGLERRRNREADWFLSGGLPNVFDRVRSQLQDFQNKLPKVKVAPVLLGTSITLLAFAIYIRVQEPEWAKFFNRRR